MIAESESACEHGTASPKVPEKLTSWRSLAIFGITRKDNESTAKQMPNGQDDSRAFGRMWAKIPEKK